MTLKELDEIDCRIDDIKSVLLEKSEYLSPGDLVNILNALKEDLRTVGVNK
ncbi:hypothetical protein [Liquorilactobacillus vini]|uniref:Uncharacterized protein n=1 Tax=Liquorilactobacillus vini DSM 20605 TaxID=1133569 RepID=A0A0R2CCI9_9LACO|nr:hypothetical protein [Liquorilactobacillus vini]KRM89518.1 hypothetical protein FD21_GL001374 [Liquorilactobacillus vini DSM 20605]